MSNRRGASQQNFYDFNIPEKANRVLNVILLTMILIIVRIWHLAVIQYDSKMEEARKPQRRTIVEPARRATIRDRYNIPLAINKMQYNAAILYSQFRQIPAGRWVKDVNGKRVKQSKRKEYIAALARTLANELQLDPDRLEDLIYSKAALYYNLPFVIKEELSEREYYRLKMLEKDWLGVQVQRLPKRVYPQNRIGADIIGYMGAINRQEYEGILHKMKSLEAYVQQRDAGEDVALPEGLSTPSEARHRLRELQDLAYTANDYVGKTGIEGKFEEALRGFQGKKSYYSDSRGNFLRELPGSRDPVPGQRILLTISAELQAYAEQLLIQNERLREARISQGNFQPNVMHKQPWLKGGAIVALDPHNGDVLALASYPRFDPNDFIASGQPELQAKKRANIAHWFESEDYIGQIWDQKRPLERERYDDSAEASYDEPLWLTWEHYINFILPPENPVRQRLAQIGSVKDAIELQRSFATLLMLSGQRNAYWLLQALYPDEGHEPHGKCMPNNVRRSIEERLKEYAPAVDQLKKTLNKYVADLPRHYDKTLLVDLCRIAVRDDRFTPRLIEAIGKQSLTQYRNASAAMAAIEPLVRTMSKTIYSDHDFKEWRKLNEQNFLKEKRAEEKRTLRYPKPYIDYLDQQENQRFEEFWGTNRWRILMAFLLGMKSLDGLQDYQDYFTTWHKELSQGAHQASPWGDAYRTLQNSLGNMPAELAISYLQTLRGFHQLDRSLLGQYRHLRKQDDKSLEKHLAAGFYPLYGYGHGRSYAYRQATPQGSLFKLVTAYAALVQRYRELAPHVPSQGNLNPLEIVDVTQRKGRELYLGYHADGTPLPQHYKGGRLPKSALASIGKVDLLYAMEMSSNPYFALLAGDVLHSPDDLADAARAFSYGSRTGIDLLGEIAGSVPTDLKENRTGLYSFAIGQHSLVVTPLQASVMVGAIANGGRILKPKIVKLTAGVQRAGEEACFLSCSPHFPYQESLASVGVDFPLFTRILRNESSSQVKLTPTVTRRELFLPNIVRRTLLDGMHRVVEKMQQGGIIGLSRFYRDYPEAISDYLELKDRLIGKTSTAESMEHMDLDPVHGVNMYTHVWFGGIAFDPDADTEEAYLIRDQFGRPELVVIVYLRFGRFGREAAPLAAQVVKKWHEIKSRQRL